MQCTFTIELSFEYQGIYFEPLVIMWNTEKIYNQQVSSFLRPHYFILVSSYAPFKLDTAR